MEIGKACDVDFHEAKEILMKKIQKLTRMFKLSYKNKLKKMKDT